MSNDFMLTTIDNPYDPFEQFTLWLLFDKEKGYDSCERLARIVQPRLTADMSDQEVSYETEKAIDEIIEHDFLNVFVKAFNKSSN